MLYMLFPLVLLSQLVVAQGVTPSAEKPDAPATAEPPVKPTIAPVPPTTKKSVARIGEITQIFRDKRRVVVNVTDGSSTSERAAKAIISFSNSEACEGTVIQSELTMMLVEFPDCSAFDKVKSGMALSPPMIAPAEVAPPAPTPVETPETKAETPVQAETPPPPRPLSQMKRLRSHFTLGVGANTATKIEYDSVTFTSGADSVKGEVTLDVGSAAQFSAGVMASCERCWGFSGQLTIESKRDVKSFKATLEDGTVITAVAGANKPTMQFNVLEANTLYRWDQFYLPFGLNYSVGVKYSLPSGSVNTTITPGGALGMQAGAGFLFAEHLRLELLVQMIGSTLKETIPGTQADFGTGYMTGALLRFGVIF